MTTDPIEAVIAAYLDHLENGGPAPSFDHLSEEDRRTAQELIDLMREGRGIDVYRSRPSLDSLLAGTEFEGWLDAPHTEGLSIDAVRPEVVSALGSASSPVADGTAQNEGIRSDALTQFQTLHIRLQFRDDITTPADLARVDPRVAAGAVFGRFPETVALVLIIGDQEFSSVAIDPFDTEPFIGTPDGQTYPPRLTRPVLPLLDTLRRVVDEFAPDLAIDELAPDHQPVELPDIIRAECASACAAIVAEGKKSRTAAKKETWSVFDERAFLVSLTHDASTDDLTEADIDERIDAAVPA
jgi:hypothetical protein